MEGCRKGTRRPLRLACQLLSRSECNDPLQWSPTNMLSCLVRVDLYRPEIHFGHGKFGA